MSKLKPKQPITATDLAEVLVEMQGREPRGRSKITMVDGKPHRLRRGVLVEIPAEWFGKVTHKQTIRKRPSKKGQGASFVSKGQR